MRAIKNNFLLDDNTIDKLRAMGIEVLDSTPQEILEGLSAINSASLISDRARETLKYLITYGPVDVYKDVNMDIDVIKKLCRNDLVVNIIKGKESLYAVTCKGAKVLNCP